MCPLLGGLSSFRVSFVGGFIVIRLLFTRKRYPVHTIYNPMEGLGPLSNVGGPGTPIQCGRKIVWRQKKIISLFLFLLGEGLGEGPMYMHMHMHMHMQGPDLDLL